VRGFDAYPQRQFVTESSYNNSLSDGSDLIDWTSGILSDVSFSQGTGSNASHTVIQYSNGEYLGLFQNTNANNFTVSDFVNSTSSAVNVSGAGGDDIMLGGSGDDTLNGNAGDDQIFGGLGDDIIIGGDGIDQLTGGAGSDQFQYRFISEAATDSSTDLASKETVFGFDATDSSEVILLDGLLKGVFDYRGAGNFLGSSNTEAIFDDLTKLLSFDIDGDASSDMELVLDGVDILDLDISNFTFV